MKYWANEFKIALAQRLGPDFGAYLFWKGRVALYAILKALGISAGDEVVLQAFTCVVVASAIKYLGGRPVYVDICPNTFIMDIEKLAGAITGKTKAVIVQNTFGLSPDIRPVREICAPRGIAVIEDCAHGLGGSSEGAPNGTLADASFFSFQWNKTISTGVGGAAVTASPILKKRLEAIEGAARMPSLYERASLGALVAFREAPLSSSLSWRFTGLYRRLSASNLIVGSSQGYEMESPACPAGFLAGYADFQARKALSQLLRIEKNVHHRALAAVSYNRVLSHLDVGTPFVPSGRQHIYLKYPLLVRDRERFLALAQKEGVEIGDWFVSPLHPLTRNLELWDYPSGSFPVAEWTSTHIVNLPTHLSVGRTRQERICRFLLKHREEILPYDSYVKRGHS